MLAKRQRLRLKCGGWAYWLPANALPPNFAETSGIITYSLQLIFCEGERGHLQGLVYANSVNLASNKLANPEPDLQI